MIFLFTYFFGEWKIGRLSRQIAPFFTPFCRLFCLFYEKFSRILLVFCPIDKALPVHKDSDSVSSSQSGIRLEMEKSIAKSL
jgi:hypothetical protein